MVGFVVVMCWKCWCSDFLELNLVCVVICVRGSVGCVLSMFFVMFMCLWINYVSGDIFVVLEN